MYLNDLFDNAPKMLIEQISCDSRVPMRNCIFFCISGVKYDGHDYIKEAIKNGASVIVHTKDIDTSYKSIFIKVKNINSVLADTAKKLYNFNSSDLDIFLTCGCYGKSCVSSYIYQLINKKDITSTIGAYGINYQDTCMIYPSSTLTLLDNYKYLSQIKDSGCKICSMETNASSLSYGRLTGIYPKVFTYTNTSQYSIDYKGLSHKYFDSIEKYLYTLEESTSIVLNKDDISYNELIRACSNNVVSYGFDTNSTYLISNPKYYIDKTTFDLTYNDKKYTINSPLISEYNVYNLTAAIASVVESKLLTIDEILDNISKLVPPEGIMEKLQVNNKNIIVDYCYALDSFSHLNNYIKQLDNINKIYFVVSVNYDDDEESLGACFEYLKDIAFLTIFTENKINDADIHSLLDYAANCAQGYNFLTIEDRKEAIKAAIDLLDKDDLLVILGKGNSKFLLKNYNKLVYPGDKKVCLDYIKSISV